MISKGLNSTDKILVSIILLIGFQQFPILRLGGSFKIYELLSLLVLFQIILLGPYKIKLQGINIISLFLFVLSPIISYLNFYIFEGYPYGFYRNYPLETSFKFNFYIFPSLQLLYMFFNSAVINSIVNNRNLYTHLNKILKYSILVGTLIAAYSLFSIFVYDFVIHLPDFIQNKTVYKFRSYGFSQEPSFYVLYQSWICIFTFYSKRLFNKIFWIFLICINVTSLILSFSTMLVGLLFCFIFSLLVFNISIKVKSKIIAILIVLLFITGFAIFYFNLYDVFELLFITKLESFFSSPDNTLDSGSFRNYTSAIGLQMFRDHFITGVGVGNSVYYMYLYEFKMGIELFGETLHAGSFPQNVFSLVLSEQGIVGGICLFLLLFEILRNNWKYRNASNYNRMFFIGTIFNVITMFTIAPVYSLFLWVFLALGFNYISNFNRYNNNQ